MTTGEAGPSTRSRQEGARAAAGITVVVTVHDDGHVELDGDDLLLRLWHHDPAWLHSVLDQAGHHGLWKPRFHALFTPRYGGRIVNLAALDHLTPCVADDDHSPAYAAETALERAARHARERGGYTLAGILVGIRRPPASERSRRDRAGQRAESGECGILDLALLQIGRKPAGKVRGGQILEFDQRG